MPDSLAEFEREIDAAAGTERWVFLDEDALEDLARSGWLASSEEGASLPQQAIGRADVPIAQRLIELGGRTICHSGVALTGIAPLSRDTTNMADAFLQLLVELAEDPLLARAFKADPESTIAGLDLSSQERQALVSRDAAKIRALLIESQPDRDWLLLAWFGSLAAAEEGEPL